MLPIPTRRCWVAREDLASAYTDALIDALESPEFERLPWRGLDNAKFEATWVIERVRPITGQMKGAPPSVAA